MLKAQKVITLNQAINDAFVNRKNIQASKSDVLIRKLQTEALYKKYWPQLNAEYTYLYNPILQTSILPIGLFNPTYPADATKSVQFGTKWTQTAGVTLYQPIIDFTVSKELNEAKLQERITQSGQLQTAYDLAYTVAQVYFDISLQESKIKSSIADTNRTWVTYTLLYNKYQQQRLLKSDLNKGKINHNNALQQYQNALSQLIEDKVYLLFLIGDKNIENTNFMVDTSYVFTKQTQLVFPTEINTSAIPEIQQLELNAELAGQQIKSEKSKYIPTLGLKGYLGANQYANNIDPTAANSWFGLSYIGLDLKYPLLFADDKKRKIQQLQLQNLQNLDRMADKTATYYKDAITAKIKIEQLNADLKKQEENLALSLESITILQNRFTEGQESASNLNLEEANLQKLIADYETNKRQYYLYYLDFLKATGKLEILWK